MLKVIGPEKFKDFSCLQFSTDPSIDKRWFKSLEVSIYGHRNSLDLQAIDRADGAYDAVVCNHILEHVPDDRASMRELVRITKPTGFVFISVPNPATKKVTSDWGYPDEKHHGHYRVYGMDIVDKLKSEIGSRTLLRLTASDPVTGTRDCGFLITETPGAYTHSLLIEAMN